MSYVERWWTEAASWMLASALVRRHGNLSVIQVHPSGGQSDRLWIGSWRIDNESARFVEIWSLNRALGGAIHLGETTLRPGTFSDTPWNDLLETERPVQFVDALEAAAGRIPSPTRDMTARGLTYDVISSLITRTRFDEHPIRCRSLYLDSAGGSGLDIPEQFAQYLPAFTEDGPYPGLPPLAVYEYWVLELDNEAIAVLHDAGQAWGSSGPIDVMAEYRRRRRLDDVVSALINRPARSPREAGPVETDGLDRVRTIAQQVVESHRMFGHSTFMLAFERRGAPDVEFYVQGRIVEPWLHLDAISNEFLPPEAALGPEQMRVLQDLGWDAPVPELGIDNFTKFLRVPDELGQAGRIIVEALVSGYGATADDHWSAVPAECVTTDLLEGTPEEPTAVNADGERHISRGTVVHSIAALRDLLADWAVRSPSDTIGIPSPGPCVTVDLGQERFYLASDTTRAAVVAYLEYSVDHGAAENWSVVATAKGQARKVVYRTDKMLPGWYAYLTAPRASSGPLIASPSPMPDHEQFPRTLLARSAGRSAEAAAARSRAYARFHLTERLTDLAAQLRSEPLAAIMYGSLELFHSNLLAWLFETLPTAADKVFTVGVPPGTQKVRSVLRENHDLDLVMTFPGKERLVIENKVFSVPTIAQLERYHDDVLVPWKAKGMGETTAMLLSVYKPAWIDDLDGWRYLGYDDLADRIDAAIGPVAEGYEGETMRRYARVARTLHQLARTVAAQTLDEPVDLPLDLETVLGDARLAMRLRKFRAHSIAERLHEATKELGGAAGAGFTKGQALIEWFRPTPMLDDSSEGWVGWQVQGDDFRRAIRVPEALSGAGVLPERIALASAHPEWFDYTGLDSILGTSGIPVRPKPSSAGPFKGFNKYDPNFLYRAKKAVGLTIRQLVDATFAIAQDLPTKQ